MAIQYPTINGHYFGFSSIEIDINGLKLRGYQSINWEQNSEFTDIYGTHHQMLGDTPGKYSASGSLEMLYPEWQELRGALGDGYMQNRFTISVVMSESGGASEAEHVVLNGVRIKKVNPSISEGTDPVKVSLDLDIMWVQEGDQLPYNTMLV